MKTAYKSKIIEILPLVLFLMIVSALSYVFITGLGPDWLRIIIMFVLVGTVLVIAVLGMRQHWKDME